MVEGWEVCRLQDIIKIKHGFAFASEFFSTDGPHVLLTPGNFHEEGGFRWLGEKQKFYGGPVPEDYVLSPGQILIVMTEQAPGLLGSTLFVPEGYSFLHNQRLGLVQIEEPGRVCAQYLHFVFASSRLRKAISAESSGTKVKHTSPDRILALDVDLPPLSEQRKIAEILRTWDEAIEKLEALRRAKLRQYGALARRFFDPCHPAFQQRPDSWREFELGEVFRERTQPGEEGDALLSVTMSEGVIDRNNVGRKDTSNEDKSRYKLILPGDIGYNTMRMWQGVSGLSMLRGIVSPAYTIVTPDNRNIAAHYAAHLFKSRRVVFDFQRYSQGLTSDTWNLKFPAFSKIKVFLPPIEQQKKQAKLFDMLRQEITAVECQSKTLTRQKRGLMQKLLTGEWRTAV